MTGDGECGREDGKAGGFDGRGSVEKGGGEGSVEAVAGGSGVDGGDAGGGKELAGAVAGGEEGSARTEFEEDVIGAKGEKLLGGGAGIVDEIGSKAFARVLAGLRGGGAGGGRSVAEESGGFDLVGGEPGKLGEDGGRDGPDGRGVKEDGDAGGCGDREQGFEGGDGGFQLGEEESGTLDAGAVRFEVGGAECGVGTGDDDDAVLAGAGRIVRGGAAVGDEDEGDTAGTPRRA